MLVILECVLQFSMGHASCKQAQGATLRAILWFTDIRMVFWSIIKPFSLDFLTLIFILLQKLYLPELLTLIIHGSIYL